MGLICDANTPLFRDASLVHDAQLTLTPCACRKMFPSMPHILATVLGIIGFVTLAAYAELSTQSCPEARQ